MDTQGWLHIVRDRDAYTGEWAYWCFFAPYKSERRPSLLQRVCSSVEELDAVLRGLGLGLERVRITEDVDRVGARTVLRCLTTHERLHELGFH